MNLASTPSRYARRAFWRPFLWRGAAFALVSAMGVAGLLLGAGVSERELADVGVLGKIYYVLGLFFLGGLDLGTPEGGSPGARFLLWCAYFGAPLITISAIIEAAVRLVDPLSIRARPLSDHVVLGGAGRLSMVYVRALREVAPDRPVVVVEQNPAHPSLAELQEVYGATIVVGDITHDEVLGRLRLGRAHRVLLLTGNDFANLDAAAKILAGTPSLAGRLVVHVSQLGFMRETAGSRVARDAEIFNGHEFAAVRLVEDHLLARFRDTPGRDLVVLAGFGRFGQTVLRLLQERAAGSVGRVVIVDEQASRLVPVFEEYPGFATDYERSVLAGDILAPEVWAEIDEIVAADGREPVFILGSGEDGTNLQGALVARSGYPSAYVIVRSFRESPFIDEVARDADVQAFHLGGLIASGMPKRWL